MNDSVSIYKAFVDELVSLKDSPESKWIKRGKWPSTEKREQINDLLAKISQDEKELITSLIDDARIAGIHDLLVRLQEGLDAGRLKVSIDEVNFPNSPFGSEINFDFICGVNGDDWPPPV